LRYANRTVALERGVGKNHKDCALLDTNRSVYQAERVVREYALADDGELTPQEKFCVACVPEAQRGSVLDIGIGAGRTLWPLARMFRRYTGIDYSGPMIDEALRRFPGHDLRVLDARRLDVTDAFDCVFFSYNGIDYMPCEQRELVLKRICTALRARGLFIFSTHNLHHARTAAWINNFLVEEMRPLRLDKRSADILRGRGINFWRQREHREAGFAYVNDPAHRFSVLTTYVDINRQIGVLERAGFSTVATIGNTQKTAGFDEQDCWVYIVAQRC
jgi:SAM-dependent methyltransferase